MSGESIFKIKFFQFIVTFFICLSAAGVGALFFVAHYPMLDLSRLERYDPGTPSVLLDCHGAQWARFALDKRKPIELADMPQHLVHAFMAAEDHAFFDHPGISLRGIARSVILNIYYGSKKQGASTITQQLIKLLYVGAAKTFTRKIKEQLMAVLIERQFSKEQILQTYLNHVYFGCGIYGVEAASQRFWGVSARDVNLAQAATLAATVKSPGYYSPLLCPLSSEQRRNVVLRSMQLLDFIDNEQCRVCQQEPLGITEHSNEKLASHLKEAIRQEVEGMVGKQELYSGGLVIQTTIDSNVQRLAESAFNEKMIKMRQEIRPEIDGALITLDAQTGAIRALIGGYDFRISKFNRATQAQRQMGSILKPLMYAAAIDAGLRFDNTFIDEPLQIPSGNTVWEPRNNDRVFQGQMTLGHALSRSNNIVTIKALLSAGAERAAQLIKKAQLGDVPAYPSLALGCIDRTLMDVVGMFNMFANRGVYVQPHYLVWVKNKWGKKIYKASSLKKPVLSAFVADQVTRVLQMSMQRAKRRKKEWIDSEAIAKTGTTNDWRTSFFAGATPELTTAIYVGCDDNSPMGFNCYASKTAFPIWFGMHKEIPCATKRFTFDQSLQEVLVDPKTGELLAENTRGAMSLLVPKSTIVS